MELYFDTLRIEFYDHESEESFTYFMGHDGGDDYTEPAEYMEKLITDDSLREISKKLDLIREIIWG